MYSALRCLFVSAAVVAASVLVPHAASADMDDVLNSSLVRSANNAIKDQLKSNQDTVAQGFPIGDEHPPISRPALPSGLTWQADFSMAKSLGNTGYQNGLPGGFDGVLGYGVTRYLRAQAGYYTFQEYPLGFDTGTVPTYLQGISAPIGTTNLATNPVDVTTRNTITIASVSNMFLIDRKFPIIVTPTYMSRAGTLGGHSDLTQIEVDGFPTTVHLRTVQYWLAAVTVPFLSSPKFFGTLTVAPQWNLNLTGVQTTNHAQLFELAYLEYRFTKNATLFFQPSRLVNNLPNDQTPQYIPTFLYGAAYKFAKFGFIQLVASTGTPSNRSQSALPPSRCSKYRAPLHHRRARSPRRWRA